MSLFFIIVCVATVAAQPEKKGPEKKGNPGDVPVIQPKEDEKKVEEKANKPNIGEQAVLPINLVKNKIETLKVGSSAYVVPAAVRVDTKRKCWLHPHFITGAKNEERKVQIRRDLDGYHVVIENSNHQWEAEDIDGGSLKWIPVKTVTIKE